MNEQEIRSLVREAIARHMGNASAVAPSHPRTLEPSHPRTLEPSHHASHHLFVLTESDGPCIIEPSVMCNHCGYCKSYGH